jgi:Mce-associated membrane protein
VAAVVDDTESLTTEDVSRHASTRGRVLVAVVVAGLVAVVVTGAVSMRADHARDAHRQELVDGATAGALALIDVHVDTVDEDVDRLRALSTGEFAEDLVGEVGFVDAIRSASVNSDARIDAAALASETGSTGVVLIAASAQVANSAGETTSRTYRLRIGVEDVDGKILMSSVEFVP